MSARLLSSPEVASLLGIELDTLYRYARRGRIRGVKVGKLWRFTEADVEEFVQSQRFHTAPPRAGVTLLPELLSRAAALHPPGGVTGNDSRLSYARIDELSDRLAQDLIRKGLAPGERALVVLPNCVEFVIACFAVWKARGVFVPESTSIRPEGLLRILRDARPAAFILDGMVAEQLEGRAELLEGVKAIWVKDRTFALSGLDSIEVESLDAVLASRSSLERLPWTSADPEEIVSISYTSGTTGAPKGVCHTHASWLAGARFTRDYPGVTSADTLLLPLPLHHGLAFRQILGYALAGGSLIIATDIYQALKCLREKQGTALLLVPAACNLVMDHFASVLQEADAQLHYVEIGSAALEAERLDRLRELLPTTPVHLPYGLTEARVAFLKPGRDGRLNRIAVLAPGLELRVVDGEGRPAGPGQTGEILLRGPGLMKGYWGWTAEPCARLREEGFRTGDMARINADGEAELLGRLDDVLKVGGRKVIPQEVEAALNRHPAVGESAVVGLPDPRGIFELELHAFVVPRDREREIGEAELLAHCRRLLEPYKVPARIHFRRSLPKSAVGKLLRQTLESEAAPQRV